MRILLAANVKVLLRDRQSLFWALAFPVMLLFFFSLFSLDEAARSDLVVGGPAPEEATVRLVGALDAVDFLDVERVPDLDEATANRMLDEGDADLALLLSPARVEGTGVEAVLLLTEDDPIARIRLVSAVESVIDDVNIELSGVPRAFTLTARSADAKDESFFDFVAPGILGLAVMTFGVIGMAASLARYRELGVLRRVRATPLPPWRFFAGMSGAYLVVAVVQVLLLTVIARLLGADAVFTGLASTVLLVLLGTVIFLNLGVIVAGLVTGTYAAEAAANAVTLPMMFLSGTFFAVDSLPRFLQVAVQTLPLTHLLTALRAVSLDGEPLWEQGPALAILVAWAVVTFFLARRVFRLEDA